MQVASDTEEEYTGDEKEYSVEEEELLVVNPSERVLGPEPGKYTIEFEVGGDDQTL